MRDIHKETLSYRGTNEGDSIFEDASDEVRQEKINNLLKKAMFKMRRSMSKDIATKIVSGLKATKFRDMLLSRRVGRYVGRTEDDDLIGPQVEEVRINYFVYLFDFYIYYVYFNFILDFAFE